MSVVHQAPAPAQLVGHGLDLIFDHRPHAHADGGRSAVLVRVEKRRVPREQIVVLPRLVNLAPGSAGG
jgi:hypothetical protein